MELVVEDCTIGFDIDLGSESFLGLMALLNLSPSCKEIRQFV